MTSEHLLRHWLDQVGIFSHGVEHRLGISQQCLWRVHLYDLPFVHHNHPANKDNMSDCKSHVAENILLVHMLLSNLLTVRPELRKALILYTYKQYTHCQTCIADSTYTLTYNTLIVRLGLWKALILYTEIQYTHCQTRIT